MEKKNINERIISDVYEKGKKSIMGEDHNTDFNRKIIAVNDMYGWLYKQGILKKAAFEFKDYPEITYFAVDVKDLEPYRSEMEKSKIKNSCLAIHHIFDEDYSPCRYSGAIELGWFMETYRDSNGCVSKSWECDLIKSLNTSAINTVRNIKEEKGIREAVKALYSMFTWDKMENLEKNYDYEPEYKKVSEGILNSFEGIKHKSLLSQITNAKNKLFYSGSPKARKEDKEHKLW